MILRGGYLEEQIQQRCRELLKALGIFWRGRGSGRQRADRGGAPVRLTCYDLE